MKQRKQLIYVEARSINQKIPRMISKNNLNTVLEFSQKRRVNQMLFDKFSYITRASKFDALPYEGLQVNHLNHVIFQQSHHAHSNLKHLLSSNKAGINLDFDDEGY